MKKRSATALAVVLWVALCVAEHKAEHTVLDDIKEKSKTLGNWASDKFSELDQFRHLSEAKKSQDVIETIEEPASTGTKETTNAAGFGTSKYELSKASRAAYHEAEEFGLDKAKYNYDEAKRRINLAKNEASHDDADDDSNPRAKVGEGMDGGRDVNNDQTYVGTELKDKLGDKYNEAKERDLELKASAEETKTEDYKNLFEASKENVSQAAGDLGASLRDPSEEL